MQPYESDPWDTDDLEEHYAQVARIAQMTDEDVRAMGYKEVYPGYFKDDPRHPYFNAEDRYLMDHPGPDWKTKENLSVGKRRHEISPNGEKWDEEQFTGEPVPMESLPRRPAPKIVPITFKETEGVIAAESYFDTFVEPRIRQSGFWICRICRKALALWPSERALRLKLYGLSLTVVFRSPFACTNCRVFEFPTVQALGREDHRHFWQKVILRWEQPQLLIPLWGYRTAWRLHYRLRIARAWFVRGSR